MASSLFNDYFTVNELVKLLIEVAEILYENKDDLFENNNFSEEVFMINKQNNGTV